MLFYYYLETEKTWIGLVASFSSDLIDDEVQIHLILIGSSGVGKTSLRKHLKDEDFDMNESPTIIMEPDYLYRDSDNVPFKCLTGDSQISANKIFLTMWDTGGQPIFQDLLPCFARLKCMYGIVFRMSDLQMLDSKPEIRPSDENHDPIVSPFSNKEIIYRNLAYFQAFSGTMKDKFENLPMQVQQDKSNEENVPCTRNYPAAVVVGTCKDLVPSYDSSSLKENREKLEKGIKEFVDANNVSVYSVKDGEGFSYIHEVDNTVSGVATDVGIDQLRDNISDCAQNSNFKIQQSWKMFKVRLIRLCYTDYVNCGVISLTEAIKIGMECNVSDPKAALIYFHELGVFRWYHMSDNESMRNFVVIHPKTLLQILSVLFCCNPHSLSLYEKSLMNVGIMTVNSFRSLLEQKACTIDDSWFMAFLEEHHLSIKVNPLIEESEVCHHLFLPSLLPTQTDYTVNFKSLKSKVSPLYVVPESGYIATGMFTRLLTALAGVKSWKIPMKSCCVESVCRNQFEFVVNNKTYVILSELSKSIRIDCICHDPHKEVMEEDLYFRILSTLNVQLQRSVPRWMKKREFYFSFPCINHNCCPDSQVMQELHFFTNKDLLFVSDRLVKCSNGEESSLLPSQMMWRSSKTNVVNGKCVITS